MRRFKNVLSASSLVIPLVCLVLCLWAGTHWAADRADRQTGFGAYMLLEVATPAILFALAVSVALRLMVLERQQQQFLCLLIAALLALASNWWLIWFVIRGLP
ncbi:hypothetical protein [Bradyrhizobium sp. Ash2021]|uniref:hypothetical protein n=1 Tax=Bradyrhizobium sp. Ash2021 TaxID=2954771 RepID=UPI002815F278|nr:hypothetical protein [Bradyrhizobium sp. Ash2021]WMT75937.1 hypothetical protein NL528_05935 [Bradyrhizobium sp. Ash2021]